MKRFAAGALALAASVAVVAQGLKPEQQIKLRQSAYTLMNYNFSSLAAMVQEKKPYNKDEAIRNADFVAMLATAPKGFFGEGTDHGHTRAKPEIWKNRPDFDSKMEKMSQEASKLPQVARSGDLAALKKQVADTDKACKACHDDYRLKEFPDAAK
jgi:cytochrome c556